MGEKINPMGMIYCLESGVLNFIATVDLELKSEDDLTEEILKEYFEESIKCPRHFIPVLRKIFNGLKLQERLDSKQRVTELFQETERIIFRRMV